ncbi:Cytosolic Fe-S cluster assembly factor nar1 [Marasmius crinis-equi]|uniref:Cytosolic Fe-S cluster assembly factor nar1 n=1 Tax=Marasmius crinis-equi TaxID=585013 RepID=A0ABR3FMK2_9AGAR
MTFSGALTLTDLNDFITPSQACIKPVEQVRKPGEDRKEGAAASTEIRIDLNGAYYEVTANPTLEEDSTKIGEDERKLEQAQVSLNDCLACSGCITSAESVLITLQSHTEVLNFLESNANAPTKKIPVISISPQTLASLAASLSFTGTKPITPRQVLRRIRVFCKEVLGFRYVYDTTFARHVALREHLKEFIERKETHKERINGGGSDTTEPPRLPMLASACPGWICYAEKTHAEMLPFISNTKSPQQVMGTLVKEWMGRKWDRSPEEIYHVTVMPCYDKKLEASRSDFYNDVYSTRDVDCVITTGELERLLKDKNYDLAQPVSGELDLPSTPSTSYLSGQLPEHQDEFKKTSTVAGSGSGPEWSDYALPELLQHPGSSSGSYLQSIISHITQSSEEPLELSVKQIRNADYEEYILRKRRRRTGGNDSGEAGEDEGEVIFKGAKCYGFRNLQNVVRKVGKESGVRTGVGAAGRLSGRGKGGVRRGRRGAVDGQGMGMGENVGYDYIEVMACPGGCVNGGGQLKPPTASASTGASRGMLLDEEGFTRDWSNEGVRNSDADTRWGSREWNKKVEEAYWYDLPSPTSTVGPGTSDGDNKEVEAQARARESGEIKLVGQSLGYGLTNHMTRITDQLYIDIAIGLCRQLPDVSNTPFRTQYRAVESEVIGLAVKW